MKYEKNRKIAGIDEYKLMKAAKFFIIPVIAVILVIVILLIRHKPAKNEAAQTTAQQVISSADAHITIASDETEDAASGETSESVQTQETVVPDEGIYEYNFDDYGLQKDFIPEINELIAKYHKARVTGDAQLLYEVFGRTDTVGMGEMQERLDIEKQVYDGFEDTVCYTTSGVTPGSYLVYVSTKLKFTGIETPAPMLIWVYAVKGENGYYLKEPDTITEEEQALLDKVSASEDVALLDRTMRQELAQAVVNDPELAALYEVWSDPNADEEVTTTAAAWELGNGEETDNGNDEDPDIRIGD